MHHWKGEPSNEIEYHTDRWCIFFVDRDFFRVRGIRIGRKGRIAKAMSSPLAVSELPRRVIIVLDIATPARDLQKLTGEIKSLGNWWHCLGHVWIVQTPLGVKEMRDRLRRRLESEDRLLILEVNGDAAWSGFEGESAGWLKDHLLPRGASTRAREQRSGLCS